MDLRVDDEQSALVASFSALFGKLSSFERVRAAEPLGFDAELWGALLDTGALTMAVGESSGGWGASLLDLELVAEQLGRHAAPAPLIEAQVAARALGRCGSPAADHALADVLAGEGVTTIALHMAAGPTAPLVPAGAVSHSLLAFDGDVIRLVEVGDGNRAPVANLASAPLADVGLDAGVVVSEGPDAAAVYEAAIDEWLVLTSAAVVGLAAVALEKACEYAVERRAFGAQIGSFQGVSHPLANDATNLDGAQLLVRKAAWALDRPRSRGRELAAMAFAFSVPVAHATTYDAVHVHGGYGFMLEHDVQLLYRRARGWPGIWGSASDANRRVAAARYGRR